MSNPRKKPIQDIVSSPTIKRKLKPYGKPVLEKLGDIRALTLGASIGILGDSPTTLGHEYIYAP